MRAFSFIASCIVATCCSFAFAHGPQIQITGDTGKIVTRQIVLDTPEYSNLTSPTRVYAMSLEEFNGAWFTRPNRKVDAFGEPEYYSGPGIAYGIDLLDGGPQVFAAGATLSFRFTAGLGLWNGTSFDDAGLTQLKAFRGGNASIASPATSFATTSDLPDLNDLVSINPALLDYGDGGVEVHNTVRYALLGDGVSPTSSSPDGVYLASLQIVSDDTNMMPSEEFHFVMSKNATLAELNAASVSLGFDASFVQNTTVPEPSTIALVGGMVALCALRRYFV